MLKHHTSIHFSVYTWTHVDHLQCTAYCRQFMCIWMQDPATHKSLQIIVDAQADLYHLLDTGSYGQCHKGTCLWDLQLGWNQILDF